MPERGPHHLWMTTGTLKQDMSTTVKLSFLTRWLCELLPIKCYTRGTTQTTGVALFSETDRPHSPAPPTRVRWGSPSPTPCPTPVALLSSEPGAGDEPHGEASGHTQLSTPADSASPASWRVTVSTKGKRKDSI